MGNSTKVKKIDDIEEALGFEGYILLTKEYINQTQKLEYICPNGHRRHTTWKNWQKGSRCLVCKNQSTKISISSVKDSFEKEGYILLSTGYKNNKTKLDYICPEGHKHSITWSDWNSGGYRCPSCAGNIKLTIDIVKVDIEKEGYRLLSDVYENNTTLLKVLCPEGHEFETTRNRWVVGHRCPKCYKGRINIDIIRQILDKEGYKLLSKEYVDAHSKLKFICPRGHEHKISWSAWNQGQRCFYCRNDNNRVSIDDIRTMFLEEGYTFIEDSFCNEKFKYICPNGHGGQITLGNWKSGNRCPHCYGNAKLKFSFVKNQIEQEGYKVITIEDDYDNNRTKLHLKCENGHDYFASWFDWNTNKVRCYKCKEKGTSIQEQELIDNIKTLDLNIEVHDRYLISPKEIDILIPSKKIAIEYCGLYWHSELMGKGRNYHIDKLEMCKEKGYNLITVFEDEFVNKKDILFSRLKGVLGKTTNTIYARKTKVAEISAQEARKFCEDNHVQGYSGSSIKIGIYYKNELVSVMTFSRPSLSKGAKGTKEGVWELSRFCTKLNTIVVGGASKLLTYFKKNYEWKEVFSYADRRWSTGNLYDQLGFEFVGETPPNYWYFNSANSKRIHRFALRKQPDEPKDVPEWELRKAQGYNRIWDCGNLKYVMHNN